MSVYQEFVKSRPIVKVDEATHEVYGLVTDETIDSDGEVCDFEAQKPHYERWEQEALNATRTAGVADSRGNVRIQHDPHKVGGKVTAITYDDDARAIYVRSTPTPDTWPLIRDGYYPMYSQAGEYARRWCGNCGTDIPRGNNCPRCLKTVAVRYAAGLAEISHVDKGSNPNATFQFVRSNGATELRKFANSSATLLGSQCDSTGFEPDGQDTLATTF